MLSYFLLLFAIAIIVYFKDVSPIGSAVGFSVIGYVAVDVLIPQVGDSFIKIGLFGKDMSKPGRPVIPETIGSVSATVYLFIMFFSIPFMFYKYLVITSGGGNRDLVSQESTEEQLFPHSKLSEFLSALLCLESTILLGAADDLFDLRWRHKFFLPAIAAIPLLVVYYVDFSVTHVLIPKFVQELIGTSKTSIDLGAFYYCYMASVAIFCPNSINILAGVNGLEVGQSIVLGLIFMINDVLYLTMGVNGHARESHLFSLLLIVPFLGVSLALFKWNRWPAKVFVGDTYCYFAGMVFAVVGILGHFSKTTLLFFLPQIFNFIYSAPQIFGLVPCPRHRLPKFNESDWLMYTSRADLIKEKPKPVMQPILRLLHKLRLIDLNIDPKTNTILDCSNMTLINLMIVWFGPMREDKLCYSILALQFIIGISAICLRHLIGSLLFGNDNLWNIV
ncbi:UDP-N-acetylglucosamine--dolichyl-phosphate N-acetylglucosaminephosphotransferase [Kluyveromyces lactis]|uniref:UDP-N-acetylglucosamine--dolichyl-phosphate N-acetylglucosaminephosphotransferase n=1 Tax=Kluyveromyces lactis (strain ATCC 8585 / CBS 2359 / DSM 70799 / NBRC 1267 / NRRL Y-1140 / WM37) TaxID=284590 RepID=Q6CL02_KLULA|nr:uncharacterized protein KLLA0_F06776g [Kluyveromyces lactis]CAG98095.1 KLLA0F06776p [Kluyveromyces lactis]|eukprot:XP_455387.1 uncharacterized protein KLLA0_F06776g [Kluyveromyces lactis]